MKKKILLFIILTILLILPTLNVKAQTIADLEKQLNAEQKKLDETNAKKALNKQTIDETNGKINKYKSDISKIESDIKAKEEESKALEKDIIKKNEEIKDLMRYYQISSSGSAMMEYVMGAKSITDLIYRLSVTEQISNYNKKMISEMNDMIKQNEEIKKDLEVKKQEQISLKSQLDEQLVVLNKKQAELSEEGISEAETIKEMKNQISSYRKLGCRDTESISACYNRVYKSTNILPSGTNFFRPTTTGRMSSGFGLRTLRGSANNHFAVDISMPIGTTVYAVAPGIVKMTKSITTACGNQIAIHHYINGAYYTSYYCHLSQINVREGTVVTKDTVIGKSGNTGNSTGPHLHLGMATGRWYVDYYDYYEKGRGSFQTHTFDPRSVITFPPIGSSYSNR